MADGPRPEPVADVTTPTPQRRRARPVRPWSREALALVGALLAAMAMAFGFAPVRSNNRFAGLWTDSSAAMLLVVAALAAAAWWVLGRPLARAARGWAIAAGAVFGLSELLGKALAAYHTVGVWADGAGLALAGLIVLAGHAWMGYVAAAVVFAWLSGPRRAPALLVSLQSERLGRLRDTVVALVRERPGRFVLWTAVVLCLTRLPYLIGYWPGFITTDSVKQMKQVAGYLPLENGHPVAHTLLIGAFVLPARALGDIDLGIAAYSLAQIVATSVAVAYALSRLLAWKTPFWVVGAAFAWYALYPVNAAYAITMWKNIPFAAAMLVVTVMLVDVVLAPETVRRPAWLVGLGVNLLGVFLLRADGPAAAIAVFIAGAILARRLARRPILATMAASLILGAVVLGPGYRALHAAPDVPEASLSLPLQQIARAALDGGKSFTAGQRAFVGDLFGGLTPAQVGALQNPELADPVKNAVDEAYLAGHRLEFLKQWAALGLAHPASYVNAFLTEGYGYWYPEYSRRAMPGNVPASVKMPGLTPRLHSPDNPVNALLFNPRIVPGVSMAYSIGFAFQAAVLMLGMLALTRRLRFAWAFLPLAVIWLVCLTSPLPGEYRYAYGYLFALPVLAALALARRPAGATPGDSPAPARAAGAPGLS